jgi:hypothetical protein
MFLESRPRPGLKADNLNTVNRLSRQCGILNISQSSTPPSPVEGIVLPYLLPLVNHKYNSVCLWRYDLDLHSRFEQPVRISQYCRRPLPEERLSWAAFALAEGSTALERWLHCSWGGVLCCPAKLGTQYSSDHLLYCAPRDIGCTRGVWDI